MKKRFVAPFGFTLVELVVVITVLAVLATVGFVSLQGYAVDARDSSRLTVLGSMERWLSMRYLTVNAYPMPDSPVAVTASGYVTSHQGYAGGGVLSKVGMGNVKDPLDGTPFTYAVNADLTKYQLLGFLEGGKVQASAVVPNAYAAAPDYSKRFPHLRGHSLGILLKENSTPVHFDSTSVDLVSATGTYVVQYDDGHSATWTGIVLRGGIGGGGIVGYWNFDEPSGTVVKDVSGNGSDGVFSGSFAPVRTAGQVRTALDFSSNSWVTSASWGYVDFWALTGLKNSSAGTPHSIVGWIRSSRPLCEDTNNCRQWVLLLGTPGTWSHHWLIGWLHWPAQFWVWSGPQIKWFTYSPGVWQHVAMTFDWRRLTGYVDGVRIDSSGQFWSQSFNMADFRLYVGGGVQESPFDGKIDELRIYSRALGESEVVNLYRSSK